MREETQLRVIKEVLGTFSKKEPFSKHLKRFFYHNRQLGSRDRRVIQQFTYNYFRIGQSLQGESTEMRLGIANYLCNDEQTPLLSYLLQTYSKLNVNDVSQTVTEKLSNLKLQTSNFKPEEIFPFHSLLSNEIEAEPFIHSHLTQPKLWIRIRGNFLKAVEDELNEKKIMFGKINDDTYCLYLKNSTSLDDLESFKRGYFEVQDRSSQQTILSIQPKPTEFWWDGCSGAGGKSLMMIDASEKRNVEDQKHKSGKLNGSALGLVVPSAMTSLSIYATDVRESVLENLKERFMKARIKNYRAEQIDVANLPENFILPFQRPLDGIVADVPCSGSGTWGRTPEWLEMFQSSSVDEYVNLQRKIVTNLVRYLPAGKPLVYITCSVFREENEENINFFTQNLHLTLENNSYIRGFIHGADTLFVARMRKSEA